MTQAIAAVDRPSRLSIVAWTVPTASRVGARAHDPVAPDLAGLAGAGSEVRVALGELDATRRASPDELVQPFVGEHDGHLLGVLGPQGHEAETLGADRRFAERLVQGGFSTHRQRFSPSSRGHLLRPDVELGEAAAEDQHAHRDQDPAADADDRAVVALDHRERGRRAREGERGDQERDREAERVDGEQEGAVGGLALDPGEGEDRRRAPGPCTASRRSRTRRRRRSGRPCPPARAARRRATRGSAGRRRSRR